MLCRSAFNCVSDDDGGGGGGPMEDDDDDDDDDGGGRCVVVICGDIAIPLSDEEAAGVAASFIVTAVADGVVECGFCSGALI